MRSNDNLILVFVSGGIDDNEIAPKHERLLWLKKWNLRKGVKADIQQKETSPPKWSDTYVIAYFYLPSIATIHNGLHDR